MNEPTVENVHFRMKKKPKHQLRYIEDQTCSLGVEQVSKLPFAHQNTNIFIRIQKKNIREKWRNTVLFH